MNAVMVRKFKAMSAYLHFWQKDTPYHDNKAPLNYLLFGAECPRCSETFRKWLRTRDGRKFKNWCEYYGLDNPHKNFEVANLLDALEDRKIPCFNVMIGDKLRTIYNDRFPFDSNICFRDVEPGSDLSGITLL